ncbi:MAG: hypothetical protein GX591_18295 [Planctomycetes bacterium]|nr:hypothetical protein [Planctomycetota bacterium]
MAAGALRIQGARSRYVFVKKVHETTRIEAEQQKTYPGLRVRRDGDAVVVHIPMRFHRRNGRNMIIAEGDAEAVPLSSPLPYLQPPASSLQSAVLNQTLVEPSRAGLSGRSPP